MRFLIRGEILVSMDLHGRELFLAPSKIICLLRNYKAHAEELGNSIPDRPEFFLKPPSSLLRNGGTVIIPEGVRSLHHEVELAAIMGRRCRLIAEEEAENYVSAYTVMLDITARDVQDRARSKGLPWSEAKGYDTFAPVGPRAYSLDEFEWRGRRIWLEVNGERRQDGNTSMMLYDVPRIISEISRVMTLEAGDLILTGTPAGVGPLTAGDKVVAGIEGMEALRVDVAAAGDCLRNIY